MAYLGFARKFRPQQLTDVIGQDHIVTTLKNAFTQERIAQSFLFVGTRGVGKTSTARILAKALNCQNNTKLKPYESCGECASCQEIINGSGFDVLEIDGASNRGIDEIRNLRDNVKFKPMHGRYKVYIIDEVHMLTQEAFNALLKTLEEPPAHVKFIFATTESHKIPQTILSRCQRHDFRQIRLGLIKDVLMHIAQQEKLMIDDKAIHLVAQHADGSLRDAESLLDKIANSLTGKISFEEVIRILGITDTRVYYDLVQRIIARDTHAILETIQHEEADGRDLVQFTKGLVAVLRDMLIVKTAQTPEKFLYCTADEHAIITGIVQTVSGKELLYFLQVIQNAYRNMRFSSFPKIDLEGALLKLTLREDIQYLADLVRDMEGIKTQLAQGGTVSRTTAANPMSSNVDASQKPTVRTVGSAPKRPIVVSNEEVSVAINSQNTAARQTDVSLPPPHAVPAVSSGGHTIVEQVTQQWPRIIENVKQQSMSLGTFLSFGRPVSFSNDQLVIAFSVEHKFNKETVETDANKTKIEQVISDCFKKTMRIRFAINETLLADASDHIMDVSDDANEEIIQSAMNIFNGRITERT